VRQFPNTQATAGQEDLLDEIGHIGGGVAHPRRQVTPELAAMVLLDGRQKGIFRVVDHGPVRKVADGDRRAIRAFCRQERIRGRQLSLWASKKNLIVLSPSSTAHGCRNADYDNIGSYYAAFFQLSIGLERLMEIAFILNHKAKHDLKNPPGKAVRALGHDLVAAYEACKKLAADRDMNMARWFDVDTPEHGRHQLQRIRSGRGKQI
jgi:hypothetical protein